MFAVIRLIFYFGLSGQLRGIHITHHHRGALDLQLAVHHTGLAAEDHLTCGVRLVLAVHIRGGNGGGAFAHAVTLTQENSQCLILFHQLSGQVGTAGHDLLDPGSEDLGLQRCGLFPLGLRQLEQPVVQALCHHGHHGDQIGLEQPQIFHQLGCVAVHAQRCHVGKAQQHIAGDAEHMVQRQNV